jgi:hypothetical protein
MIIAALSVLYITGAVVLPGGTRGDLGKTWPVVKQFGANIGTDALALQSILLALLGALLIARVFARQRNVREQDELAAAGFAYIIAGLALAIWMFAALGASSDAAAAGHAWSAFIAGGLTATLALWTGVRTFGTKKVLRRRAKSGLKLTRAALRRYRTRRAPTSVRLTRIARLLVFTWCSAVAISAVTAVAGHAELLVAAALTAVAAVLALVTSCVALLVGYARASAAGSRADHAFRMIFAWSLTASTVALAGTVALGFNSPAGATGKWVCFIAMIAPLLPAVLPVRARWWSLTGLCAGRCHLAQRRARLGYLLDLHELRHRRRAPSLVGWPRHAGVVGSDVAAVEREWRRGERETISHRSD